MRRVSRALGVGVTAALVGGALGLATPSSVAQSPEAPYTCTAPVVGAQTSISRYDTTLPEVVYVGESSPVDVKVFSTGVAPWAVLKMGWDLVGLRKVGASSTMPLTIGGVTKDVTVESPVIDVVSGQDAALNGEGSWGTWTPPATPQLVQAKMATSYQLALKLLKANGSQAIDAGVQTCTWSGSDQAQLVADTVRVMARSSVTMSAESVNLVEDDALVVEARVAVTAGSVAGKVTFTAGPKSAVATVTNGVARATITGLPLGGHPLTATFAPTEPLLYDAASAEELLVTVAPPVPAITTETTMTLDRASITTDDEAKATLQVSAAEGAAAGTVRVVVGGKPYTGPVVDGSATVTLPRLRAGSYQVTGAFVPANPREYAPSTASPLSLTVVPGAGGDLIETNTWLEVPKTTLTVGTSMSVTAVVSAAEAARGRVDFHFANRTMSSPVVNGRSVVSLPFLGEGAYEIEAEFVPAASSGFVASAAQPVTFVVEPKPVTPEPTTPEPTTPEPTTPEPTTPAPTTPAPTTPEPTTPVVLIQPTTTRIADVADTPLGGTVSVSASVAVASGAAAQGSVTFTVGGTTASVPVVAGGATASFPASVVGAVPVLADFVPASPAQAASGDSAFARVVRGASSTAVAVKVNAKKAKAAVRVTVTAPGGTCKAPVTITLKRAKAVSTVKRSLTCAGIASAKFGKLRPGTYKVTVAFAGTSQANGSSATTKVKVKARKR